MVEIATNYWSKNWVFLVNCEFNLTLRKIKCIFVEQMLHILGVMEKETSVCDNAG